MKIKVNGYIAGCLGKVDLDIDVLPPATAPVYPTVIAYTEEEGGEWHPFTVRSERPYGERSFPAAVNAIRFDDGRIWDCVNGWRPVEPY